jgi:pyrimidine operon attenuation protein / uracil phosphoribosyltransferase
MGIHTGGVYLAERVKRRIAQMEETEPPMGMVDITLYRDDAFMGLPRPIIGETVVPECGLQGRNVVLVDDVLYTGRTIRAALDALMDFGRPARIQLAVLVDRGLRELPIQPDVVGMRYDTRPDQQVEVELVETGGDDEIVLYGRTGDVTEASPKGDAVQASPYDETVSFETIPTAAKTEGEDEQ